MSVDASRSALSADPALLGRVTDLCRAAVRRMRTHLVNRIGVDVPVRFSDVGTVSWGELAEQFLEEGQGIYVRFALHPGGHEGVLAIDGALLFRIMGLLLGEDPYGVPAPYLWRAPTRMDLTAARRVASDVFAGLVEALPAREGARLEILEVTGSPRLDVGHGPLTLMLDATLDFGPPEDPYGLMTLSLPLTWASSLWPSAPRPTRQDEAGVARVLPLPVTAVAELARLRVPYGRLETLAPGDVLDLGGHHPVTLTVAGRPGFVGEAGVVEGTRCVRILARRAEGGVR
jgi:flagellar motor switch protein FliM